MYGGGHGRGEIFTAINTNQLNGDKLSLYGGGNGRGEILTTINTLQLDGNILNLYGGGNGRGEILFAANTNQLDGNMPNLYGGGNGRGEIFSAINTLQLDGVTASLYMGGNGRGEILAQLFTIPLPVKLISFGASPAGKEIKVYWQTSSEINSSFFDVEKSVDGRNWKFTGTVKAAGNSNTVLNYQLYDTHPVNGLNYYRLKSIDTDGKFTYSSVAIVHFKIGSVANITVYPNPVKYQFTLSIAGIQSITHLNLTLVNAAGQTVLKKQDLSGNTQTINMEKLTPGTYYLMVNNKGEVSTIKILKE